MTMVTLGYKVSGPPFDPEQAVDWAEVRGNYVTVSQDGWCYTSGPYPSVYEAELASFRLKYVKDE